MHTDFWLEVIHPSLSHICMYRENLEKELNLTKETETTKSVFHKSFIPKKQGTWGGAEILENNSIISNLD